MKCLVCKSPKILRFVDGFGERRIYCRACARSFLENNFVRLNGQKSLQEFNSFYKNLPASRVLGGTNGRIR